MLIAAATLIWAGALASLIAAVVQFSRSDFEPASFLSLFAAVCGVIAGGVVFKRPAVAVVGVLIASLADARNLFYWYSLPPTFNTFVNAAVVLLISGGALAGVATMLSRNRQVPNRLG
jgi:hypothetical protein